MKKNRSAKTTVESVVISVDLIGLIERVAALEARCAKLEGRDEELSGVIQDNFDYAVEYLPKVVDGGVQLKALQDDDDPVEVVVPKVA